MKKFYTLVSAEKTPVGFEIHLDGRPLKTPAKHTLICDNEALANAVTEEWAAQGEEIKPATMPLTQIISTKIDRVTGQRDILTPELTKFLNTDLICYFADHPPELIARQEAHWRPILDWFADTFGTQLEITNGLQALTQPEDAHKSVHTDIGALSDNQFTILQIAVPAAGSLILGLAFTHQHIDSQALFNAVRVEEHFKAKVYNEEKYGPDPAQAQKDEALLADLQAAEKFLKLLN